jgi:hypothetical protein
METGHPRAGANGRISSAGLHATRSRARADGQKGASAAIWSAVLRQDGDRNPNRLGANMKRHHLGLALLLAPLIATPALSQPAAETKPYVPDLADVMGAAQLRHFKLWFAGRSQNWELARYEIEQIRNSFEAAANDYPKSGDADIAGLIKTDGYPALDAVKSAVEARSNAKFAAEFDKLTQACNGCHRATHFGFIQIQVPTASPFSNQSFVPQPK